MEYKIFYSWQSDLPHKSNRSFIREAIDEAIGMISKPGVVEDAPRVDEGMDGVAGTPEVATIMFQKIDTSAIFIGDVSLVGSTEPADANREKKRVPNPNVLLEMGYAAARIGWSRWGRRCRAEQTQEPLWPGSRPPPACEDEKSLTWAASDVSAGKQRRIRGSSIKRAAEGCKFRLVRAPFFRWDVLEPYPRTCRDGAPN